MKLGDKYFVRIDQKLIQEKLDKSTFDEHLKYVKNLATESELFAGTFAGLPGGMLLFKAKDFSTADAICKKDPIMVKGFYTYKLYGKLL